MSTIVRNGCLCLSAVLALLSLTPAPAAAQCDDNTRENFRTDVANGASNSELEAKYGHCRTASAPATLAGDDGLAIKTSVNSNIFWERMNGCGYHPQAEMASCDVEIRRSFGYGAFGCWPAGSFEYVRFCFDCGPAPGVTWDFQTLGFVHVTNNNFAINPNPIPPWFHEAHATTFAAPALCTNNDGGQMTMRTILSWAVPPPPCAAVPINQQPLPIFGMVIDETVRRDP